MSNEKTFESSIERIEQIITTIEENQVTLDESIDLYKEGMLLSKFCMEKLNGAEAEVSILTKDYNNIFTKEKFD